MENIVIEERQSKILRIHLLGLFMTVLSAIIFMLGIKNKQFVYGFIGVIGVLFFGICTIYSFMRTIKPKALLTITVEGIEDSSTAGCAGFIPFREVESFEIVNIFGQKMIGVNPKDVDQFVNKLPQIKQKAARTNLRMKMPPVAIRVDTARDMSIEDILTLLQKRLSDYSSLYD